MGFHRMAGLDFHFPVSIPELSSFKKKNVEGEDSFAFAPHSFCERELISLAEGWVGGTQRSVEVYDTPCCGTRLKVEGCGEYFVAPHGQVIGKLSPHEELDPLDREVIAGPALVLALALRGVLSMHASAAMYKGNVIAFLGESGQGKSTLAGYLSQYAGWQLVADDILPIKIDAAGVHVLPHFPQLKLEANAQPGINLPEQLPLKYICVLAHAETEQMPELQKISTAQGTQSLLGHIAGTRMFNESLLAKHLQFSMWVASQTPAYRLIHPHRRDTMPLVRDFLERIC